MSSPSKPPVLNPAILPERTLHRLFLTLFLRGRSSRGLQKSGAPKSVSEKLAWTLVLYAAVGIVALGFMRQSTFALSLYLHAMTFAFLGMFVGSSSGEVLFNKEEADILLHRPVTPRALLWAKISVLVKVSLWLAGAFNLVGLFVGTKTPDGSMLFPIAHAISTALEALLCTGCVVLAYQLCLHWFGRERLDGLMTMVQVFVAVAAVLGGQIVPRILVRFGKNISFDAHSWWVALLPPAWFAGFDDAIAGRHAFSSWMLALAGLVVTSLVLWLAFGKLAADYESGLQKIGETISKPKSRNRRRWLPILVNAPPLRWWLRDSVSRASFLLTAAYLVRDRDVKLRVYPGIAPMLVFPVIFLLQPGTGGGNGGNTFGIAFAGSYLGIIPLLSLGLLQFSQQWQAADLFRAAPLHGPAQLCHGARRAVLFFLGLPMLLLFGLAALFLAKNQSELLLMLPGIIAVPVYALIPCIGGHAVPLSTPTEEAKSAGRGVTMIVVMLISAALAGLSIWSWSGGWFRWYLLGETIAVVIAYVAIRASLAFTRWPSME